LSALAGATFRGATLKDVSFHLARTLSKKYFRAVTVACFDDATMDKLTYAALKGMEADLSKVTII